MENMTVEELWKVIVEQLEESKEPYAKLEAVYEFHIADQDVTYQIAFHAGEATVFEGRVKEADCALSMKEADFKKLLLGKLNSTMAYMSGKLKVKGSIQQALALEKMLKQFDSSKS